MKLVTIITAAALALGSSGMAFADAGGVPNDNAYPDETREKGRKVICVPPGSVFRETAKDPGSNSDPLGSGMPPGAIVVSQCQLGPPG